MYEQQVGVTEYIFSREQEDLITSARDLLKSPVTEVQEVVDRRPTPATIREKVAFRFGRLVGRNMYPGMPATQPVHRLSTVPITAHRIRSRPIDLAKWAKTGHGLVLMEDTATDVVTKEVTEYLTVYRQFLLPAAWAGLDKERGHVYHIEKVCELLEPTDDPNTIVRMNEKFSAVLARERRERRTGTAGA